MRTRPGGHGAAYRSCARTPGGTVHSGGVRSVFRGLLHLFPLPGRPAGGTRYAAPFGAAQTRARRQRGHRRRPGGYLSIGIAGRLAADRPHAAPVVRPASRAAAAAAHGRPGPLPGGGAAVSGIRVVSPGLLTTVQDLGRFGWTHFGISASGAADPFALRAGNLLVGNAENTAALEMTLIGGAFEFEVDTVVALSGSDFGAGLALWSPVEVKAGQTVRCGPSQSGAHRLLCLKRG